MNYTSFSEMFNAWTKNWKRNLLLIFGGILRDNTHDMISICFIFQPISLCFQVNTLKSDLQDSHKHISYLKRSIRCQERELQHNER